MKEINIDKIKDCEIVVGIPSYNEADSISNVVKVVDEGLVKYDGSITNHLCYPIVYGLLGIDIFMTMNAIKFGAKLGQVDLGFKIHKTSAPKLDNMFLEVASSLFSFLPKERVAEIQKPAIVCDVGNQEGFSLADFNQKERTAREKEEINEKIAMEFKENYSVLKSFIPEEIRVGLEREFFEEKSFGIDGELWAKSVYCLLGAFRNGADKAAVLKLLRALFFARRNVFVDEIRGKSYNDLEVIVQKEAEYFGRCLL
ncbi:hypothetical protein KJ756_02815 [Patescibacteria group bacterium]|nr:hypothetical protein [Patescibacteria group bacterium]